MPVSISRFDYYIGLSSIHRQTIRVLPTSKVNKIQKVVIGDDTGTVLSLLHKRDLTTTVWSTPPFRHDISALTLSPDGSIVYVATGATITGIRSKKGTTFFSMITVLSDDIISIHAVDNLIYSVCEYAFNAYTIHSTESSSGNEVSECLFYQSKTRITSFLSHSLTPSLRICLIASADKCIRIITDTDEVLQTIQCNGSATFLHSFNESTIIFGTDLGHIGQLLVSPKARHQVFSKGSTSDEIVDCSIGWYILNENQQKAGVTCIKSAYFVTPTDRAASNEKNILIGREDGLFEIYAFDSVNPDSTPIYSYDCSECIQSIDSGYIRNATSTQCIVGLFSGKLLVFCNDSSAVAVSTNSSNSIPTVGKGLFNLLRGNSMNSAPAVSSAAKPSSPTNPVSNVLAIQNEIQSLTSDIEVWTNKVDKEREKYVSLTGDNSFIMGDVSAMKIKHKFDLSNEQSYYTLSIEIPVNIDVCILQSAVPLMCIDSEKIPQNDASGLDLVSKSDQAIIFHRIATDNGDMLCYYRSVKPSSRIAIRIRTVEGQFGNVTVFVIPNKTPKTCHRLIIPIKPLSLHKMLTDHEFEKQTETDDPHECSELLLSGAFTEIDIHAWVSQCLPEVTPLIHSEISKTTTLYYRSVYTHTVLICEFSSGNANFKSDNPTALSIIKEILTREATSKKIKINSSFKLNPSMNVSFLSLLRPQLTYYYSLERQYTLLPAIIECITHESDYLAWMDKEYIQIYQNRDTINYEYFNSPRALEFLRGLITDLYVDYGRLKGKNVTNQVNTMLQSLKSFDYEKLALLFKDL